MMRQMLRAKIHRITVTERDLTYEGSLTLDPVLMQACDMRPFERVDVYDVDNGNRFSTYLIEGTPGEGECCLNGAAAHKVGLGDKLILCSYCTLTEEEIESHEPKVVFVDDLNRIKEIKATETPSTPV